MDFGSEKIPKPGELNDVVSKQNGTYQGGLW
jgi:hypothetical protein